MARKSTRTARQVEPEDESQEEIEALEVTEPDEAEAEELEVGDGPKMSKVDAIRTALAAGED